MLVEASDQREHCFLLPCLHGHISYVACLGQFLVGTEHEKLSKVPRYDPPLLQQDL